MHEKWLIANGGPGTQHGMTETKRFALPDINTGNPFGDNIPNRLQQFVLAARRKSSLKLRVAVEVVFDRAWSLRRSAHGPLRTEQEGPRLGAP